MKRQQQYDFHPDNSESERAQARQRQHRGKLTAMVPVRFPPETLDQIRRCAHADDRSVSSWIRHAVERELQRDRPAS